MADRYMSIDRVLQVPVFTRRQRCCLQRGDVGGRRWWKARILSDGGKIQIMIILVAVSLGMLARQSQGAGERKFVIVGCFPGCFFVDRTALNFTNRMHGRGWFRLREDLSSTKRGLPSPKTTTTIMPCPRPLDCFSHLQFDGEMNKPATHA
jgi:hypothetical protein